MVSLTLLLALNNAHAVDILVSANGGSLQAALDAAAAGDVIVVDQNVTGQTASLDVNFGFTIRGPGTITNTDLTFSGNANNAVVLQDLTIRGGSGAFAAVAVETKPLVVRNVSFVNNPGGGSAGALSWNGPANSGVTIEDSSFEGNQAPAVSITGGDAAIFTSVFDSNGAGQEGRNNELGGGLFFDGDEITLGEAFIIGNDKVQRGNRFVSNYAFKGGGAYIRAGSGTIDNNSFDGNIANDFGRYDPVQELFGLGIGVEFDGAGVGAGLFLDEPGTDGELTVRWNNIVSNWGWDGAGIHMENPEDVVMANNLVAQNWAVHLGGGLSVIESDSSSVARPAFYNNTFAANLAGLTRVLLTIQVVGGGGNARIEGVIPEFRNNVVSHALYGGGILGKVLTGPFEAGDDFNNYFQYNLYFHNCDLFGCDPGSDGDRSFTGNYEQYAQHPTNIEGEDPLYLYFGDERENAILSDNDAYPDVFCTFYTSIVVNSGDLDHPNENNPSNTSDIGWCGGRESAIINRDRDGDGWAQYYDCLDDPDVSEATETFPGAEEVCDYEDNDCNGIIDDEFDNQWWPDADGDGYGDSSVGGTLACNVSELPGNVNWVANRGDCDDANGAINEGATELCDSIDNNCNGIINGLDDEDAIATIDGYRDTDGDSFGADNTIRPVCEAAGAFFPVTEVGEPSTTGAQLLNYVSRGGDCRDDLVDAYPGAPEQCDAVDHNCNGDFYDVQGAGATEYFPDFDKDGYGEGAIGTGQTTCGDESLLGDPPAGAEWVPQGGDCDEGNVTINPGVGESCDGIDNDCNGIIDENPVDARLLYEDFDNDGFGNPATALRSCDPGPSYTASVGGDCDDNDPTVGQCSDCGCQAVPTPGSAGLMLTGLMAMFGLRRRRA